MNRSAFSLLRVALAAFLLLTACQSEQTTRSGEIGVDRKQSMTTLVSSREVEQQASQEYAQVLAGARKKGLLNQDPPPADFGYAQAVDPRFADAAMRGA